MASSKVSTSAKPSKQQPAKTVQHPRPSGLKIGVIVGFHGLRGEAKVRPADRDAAWMESLEQATAWDPKTGKTQVVTVDSARFHGPTVLLRFVEFEDRTAVEPLMGAELYAKPDELPEPEDGEYWANDLIGLTVLNAGTQAECGRVKDLLSSTGAEFLEIAFNNGQVAVIPFLERFFPIVDVSAKTVTLDLPPGFIDSEASKPAGSDG